MATSPTLLPTQAPFFQGQPYQPISAPWLGIFSELLQSTAAANAAAAAKAAQGGAPGDSSGLMVDGVMDPVMGIVTLTVSVTPPAADTGFLGCHLYVEIPDQSAAAPATVGTSAAGSDPVNLPWSPIDLGKQTYDITQQPWTITLPIPAGIDPTVDVNCRLDAPSFSATSDNPLIQYGQPGASPSQTFLLVSLASGTPTAGEKVTAVCGPITALVLPDDDSTGKLKTPVLVTVSTAPATIQGWVGQLILTPAGTDPTQPANQQTVGNPFTQAGPVYGSPDGVPIPHSFGIDTPTVVTSATVWAITGLTDAAGNTQWNNLVPGITPGCPITYGTSAGTTDAASVMLASIEASMAVVSGLFGVAALGITNPLLGTQAVATINIANLAVTNPILAALCVQAANLGNSSVTAVAIANLAVGTAAIQTAAITYALIANLAVSSAQIQIATILGANIALATIADANIGSCSISKLLAATANFTGTATFQSGTSGPSVAIDSTGITVKASNNKLTATATQATMTDGTAIFSVGSGVLQMINGTHQAKVTANMAQFTNGTFTVGISPTQIQISDGLNTLTANGTTLVLASGAASTATLSSLGLTLVGGAAQAVLSSTNGLAITAASGLTGSVYLNGYSGGSGISLNGGAGGGIASLNCLLSTGWGYLSLGTNVQPLQLVLQGSIVPNIAMTYFGTVSINGQQVLAVRKTGPGPPSGFADATAQTWCTNLFNALASASGHGLII